MGLWDRVREMAGMASTTGPLPDDEPVFDCAANRHEAVPIRASTAGPPLGYTCKICRARCDADGKAVSRPAA